MFIAVNTKNFIINKALSSSILRRAAVKKPRVQADFAYVVSVEQPTQEPLQPQSVAPMGNRAKLALVCVPVVGTGVDAFAFVTCNKLATIRKMF